MIYADRLITGGHVDPITSVPQNVLFALGISVTSATAAYAITASRVSANPDNKDVKEEPSYDPAALVRNDGSTTASLTKVQILFWTAVAIVVYLITSFHQLGTIAACGGGICSLPDIDTTLMLFMGLGHASYIGGKLATGTIPTITSVSDTQRDGSKVITLSGFNLGSSGSILINGQPRDDLEVVTWTPNAVAFVIPQLLDPQISGAKITLAVSVGGVASPPVTYTYTAVPTGPATETDRQPPKTGVADIPQRPLQPPAAPRKPSPPAVTSVPANFVAGIDVSYSQGNSVDWDAVKSGRLAEFAYSRATFGANPSNNDPNFIRNHNECKRLGIAFGAYHFFVFDVAAADQARLFLQRIDGYTGQLCPMVDVEEASRPTDKADQSIQNLRAFLEIIERNVGSKALIYTNQNTWNTYLAGTDVFGEHRLWVANLNGNPNISPAMPRGFADWTLYQYSSKGKLPLRGGTYSDVDLNVLKGGIEAIALSHTPPPRAVPALGALAKVQYDGIDKKIKALDADGNVIFQCQARNDSVSEIAWRADAGCPPGLYVLASPETNNPNDPSTQDNNWIGEGQWFIPVNGVVGHTGIGIHGGGSCTTPPTSNALRARQGWCPTENCIRLQNEDLETFARLPVDGKPIEVIQPPNA